MTKIVKAAPATPASAMIDVRPDAITITDSVHAAWPAACALIRMGWTINPDMPPEVLAGNGKVAIFLVRTTLDTEAAVIAMDYAKEAEELAAASHALAYLRDVQQSAATMVENAKKAEAQARIDTEIAVQTAALQALMAAKAVA